MRITEYSKHLAIEGMNKLKIKRSVQLFPAQPALLDWRGGLARACALTLLHLHRLPKASEASYFVAEVTVMICVARHRAS